MNRRQWSELAAAIQVERAAAEPDHRPAIDALAERIARVLNRQSSRFDKRRFMQLTGCPMPGEWDEETRLWWRAWLKAWTSIAIQMRVQARATA